MPSWHWLPALRAVSAQLVFASDSLCPRLGGSWSLESLETLGATLTTVPVALWHSGSGSAAGAIAELRSRHLAQQVEGQSSDLGLIDLSSAVISFALEHLSDVDFASTAWADVADAVDAAAVGAFATADNCDCQVGFVAGHWVAEYVDHLLSPEGAGGSAADAGGDPMRHAEAGVAEAAMV